MGRNVVTREGDVLRVMTWNIHGAVGRNRRFDLKRVVDLIRRSDPDIIALQEVDSRRAAKDGEDPFAVLQTALGSHGVGAKSITTTDGEYGQTLISRWPMRGTEIRDISYLEREPRRAIKSDIETPCGPLRVIAAHLGLSISERRSQTKALLELVGESSATTVVLGDFNDWFWVGSVRSALARELPGQSRLRTFPSFCPILQLDHIYCRPPERMVRSFTDPEARHISDHLPVFADLRC
jgi:endonuclease/exonuclease/phosphatase family metal-dependent hydrolase